LYKVTALGLTWALIMVKIKQIPEQQDHRTVSGREPYLAPILKVFGPVGALTQGGSPGMMEGVGQTDMKL
jgi:hypothetical protein